MVVAGKVFRQDPVWAGCFVTSDHLLLKQGEVAETAKQNMELLVQGRMLPQETMHDLILLFLEAGQVKIVILPCTRHINLC